MSDYTTMEGKLWLGAQQDQCKNNEMDKVFTLSGECSAIQHYVTFPDVLDWLLKCEFDY